MAGAYVFEQAVLKEIQRRVEVSTLTEVAANNGITKQYLSDILTGRRAISGRIAKQFGFERIVKTEIIFREIK